MTFRIALVQPIANPIEEAEKNIADAVNFIARAKSEGAEFVCFPETYPGPWRMPATIVRADAGRFAVGFAATDETRANLIRFVYSGRYSADVPQIAPMRVAAAILGRVAR